MVTVHPRHIDSDEFRSVAAKSLDGFLVVGVTGDILEANDSYCCLMGYSRQEIIKRHISEIDAIESAEDVSKRIEELIKRGALRFQTRHIHKNGSFIDVEVSTTYSPTHGGTFYSFIRDITEHKRHEIALRQSEERYRNIVENQTEFVDRYLPGGILTYVNESLVKFAGVPKEDLLGISFYPFLHEADRAETVRRIESISVENPIVETESRIVLADEKIYWIRWTHTGFFDESGNLVEYQSVGKDITERREAKLALEESEKRYRTLFQKAGEGICIMSPLGELIQVNEAFAQSHGYDVHEILAMNIRDLDVNGGVEENPERGQAILSGETITFEVEHYHKDGHVFHLEVKASLISLGGETLTISFHRDISERLQTEKILQESEQMFRALVASSSQSVWSFRPGGLSQIEQIDRANASWWCEYTGQSETQRTANGGLGWLDAVYEPDREMAKNNWLNIIAASGPASSEYRVLRRDGDLRWLQVRGVPIEDAQGTIIEIAGTVTDITERKLAEIALKEKEYELEQAQILAKAGSWTYDPVIQESAWSRGMFQIWGLDPDLGLFPVEDHQKYIHPDDYPKFETVLKEAVEHGVPYNMELRINRPDGIEKTIVTICEPICDVTGKVVKLRGSNQDITERKKLEEVQSFLLNSNTSPKDEDFFESLARYLAKTLGMDYVCIDRLLGDCLSAKTMAVYHDGKFEDNVEYTLKDTPCGDVVGKEVCVFPREVRSLFPQDEALQDLQAESYVGTTLWSFDMKPIGLIAVIGRKELNSSSFAESVLKMVSIRAAGELERRQVEAEKHALEQQFQQAQKLESLGVLAGGIAHDFNNILAIILGYCGLTKMDYETTENNISAIEKAVERAAVLCRQMLAYAGKAPFEKTQVDLCMVVSEMSEMLHSTIAQNVVIKPELSADVPSVIGDASQIRQVVMNLIINAGEAIGDAQGEVRVSLSKKVINKDGAEKDYLGKIIPYDCYACLEVADTGSGMSEETYNRIFEPFYSTKFYGRGLGMSAVLGIIKSHNGALQLSSELGKGTTFKIYLPVQINDYSGEEQLQQVAATPWRGSGTILLVEDEEQVLLIARTMLQRLGFTVIEASNGMEALELYQKNAADINLVVTDIGMPVMDGYQLFRELKALRPDLPIIISSGFSDSVVESRIASEDIAGSFGKPYSFDRMREVLKRTFEGLQ